MIADSPNLKAVSLCRVLFSLDIAWPPKLELSGLESEAWAVRTETSDFDLSVSLWVEGEAIRGVVEYKTALFDEDTIATVIADYRELLMAVGEKPEIAISSLPPARRRPDADGGRRSSHRGWCRTKLPTFHQSCESSMNARRSWASIPLALTAIYSTWGRRHWRSRTFSERIRRIFQVQIPLAALFQARTVGRIAAIVRDGLPECSKFALAPIQPAGSQPPLFLCEGIGIYYPLIHHLGNDQPVYGLVTEVAHDFPCVEGLALSYIKEVRALQPEGPYFLGGLSFGGIVAFELAQQLYAAGQEVALLVLFDTPTPWASVPKSLPNRMAGHLSNLRRFGLPYAKKRLGKRLNILRGKIRSARRRWTNSEIIADTYRLRHLLTTTANQYKYSTYPGRLTLFVLSGRDGMSDSLFDPALGDIDPQLGWGRIAAGGVDLHEAGGDHISMFREPDVRRLAEKLTHSLEKARAAVAR